MFARKEASHRLNACAFLPWMLRYMTKGKARQSDFIRKSVQFHRDSQYDREFIEWQIMCSQDFVLIISKMFSLFFFRLLLFVVVALPMFSIRVYYVAGVNATANWQMSFNSSSKRQHQQQHQQQ